MPAPYNTMDAIGDIEEMGYRFAANKQRKAFVKMGMPGNQVAEEMRVYHDYFGSYKKKR